MAEITNVLDEVVQYPQRYTVTDEGDGTSTIEPYTGIVSETGTALDADLLNSIQKNNVFSVDGTRAIDGTDEVYSISITGLSDFGIFNGMKILLTTDKANTQNPYIRLNSVDYPIYYKSVLLRADSFAKYGTYLLEYDSGNFYLVKDNSKTDTGYTGGGTLYGLTSLVSDYQYLAGDGYYYKLKYDTTSPYTHDSSDTPDSDYLEKITHKTTLDKVESLNPVRVEISDYEFYVQIGNYIEYTNYSALGSLTGTTNTFPVEFVSMPSVFSEDNDITNRVTVQVPPEYVTTTQCSIYTSRSGTDRVTLIVKGLIA